MDKKDQLKASAPGTCNIVDAIDKGAAFALDIKTDAFARILEDKKEIISKNKTAKEIAYKVREFFGYDCGIEVIIKNSITPNAGFGEKEAITTATMLAVTGALAKKYGSINEFKIDLHHKDQFMIIDRKIVDKKKLIDICTGQHTRFDRINASFYGGFVVADNKKKKILRRGEMETLHAIIFIPDKPKRIEKEEMRIFESELEIIFQEALKGNLNTAMKMNSILYGGEITKRMISAKALGVSRSKEGGLIGLVREKEKIKEIKEAIREEGTIHVINMVNQEAQIQIRPKRIYKINDFMKLKGKQQYSWL